ncbi:hypothetical protein DH2020_042820 [Rehmannia glutinosa]|uniref:Uncharacterized protein n=1 Tax=Rehmannia glutinosa TaxID=99300 RepID=A0ABR0UMB8_REHGL
MSQLSEAPSAAVSGGGVGEIMLFGVRVKVDPMRKSASMNNLSDYEPVNNDSNPNNNNNEVPMAAAEDGGAAGYASADDAVPHPSNGSRERKRGVPWTEEEHKLFLIGLQKVGRGIGEESLEIIGQEPSREPCAAVLPQTLPLPITSNVNGFSVVPFTVGPVLFSMQNGNPMENSGLRQNDLANNSSPMLVRPVPVPPMPTSSSMVDLNLKQEMAIEPSQLSLRLSLSSGQDQPSTRGSAFQMMPSLNNGDSFISVA